MNISSKSLGLGLVLFLGACSVTEGKFLENVKGKTMYADAKMTTECLIGTFSADGKTFGDNITSPKFTFVEASDDSTATYSYTTPAVGLAPEMKMVYTIKTTDGKTGTMSITVDGEAQGSGPVWFK